VKWETSASTVFDGCEHVGRPKVGGKVGRKVGGKWVEVEEVELQCSTKSTYHVIMCGHDHMIGQLQHYFMIIMSRR